ncbi:hypothetical protein R6Y95_02150 [Methanoculleus palmolei]|jgi:hypothetical protein|uniref:DUF6531 domain-containing protein n=1 Tax=Methanoculleus palmolei TaxID=72612 RepID=A0ABD8A9F1_9EURY|nr:hypothetical protein R6Y95_02150 [Methanoculleus palmolei]
MNVRYSVVIILLISCLLVVPATADVSWHFRAYVVPPLGSVAIETNCSIDGEPVWSPAFPTYDEGGYPALDQQSVYRSWVLWSNTSASGSYPYDAFTSMLVDFYGVDPGTLAAHSVEALAWLDFFLSYGPGGVVDSNDHDSWGDTIVSNSVGGGSYYGWGDYIHGDDPPGIYRFYQTVFYDDYWGLPVPVESMHRDFIIGNATWWAWLDKMRDPVQPTPTPGPILPILPILGNLTYSLHLMSTLGTPGSNPYVPFSFDPVNLATGNYVYQYQDLFIPGRGLPLAITRLTILLIP